jgi:hypothetical protein
MIITTKEAPDCINEILRAGHVPMLHGSPGTGKSSIAHQVAANKKLKVIDLRLSQSDPTDLAGFPAISKAGDKAGYVPMDTFPIKGDRIPDGHNGWLLLLDEFNSAPMSVQAAAYKLVLDKQVGQHELHDQVYTIAAGNLASDKAIVNRLSTAMQSRMIHLQIELDPKDWINWAIDEKIDHRVIAYIGYRPEMLHKFDPDHSDFTFPCARTWEFASDIIKPWASVSDGNLAILAGTVGEGAATEFRSYCEVYKDLLTIQEILRNPGKVAMPTEPSILWALTGVIAEHTNNSNIDKLILFIERMAIEFQALCLKAVYRRTPTINQTPEWKSWIKVNAQEFM